MIRVQRGWFLLLSAIHIDIGVRIGMLLLCTLATVILITNEAYATGLVWNGFGSIYGKKSLTDDIYESSMGSRHLNYADGSRIGLNLRSDFTKDWAVVAQILASGGIAANATTNPKWDAEFDWFYLTHNFNDAVSFKIGRQLLPVSLVAEYIDVGLTYPWVRSPPQTSVPVKTLEGVSAFYQQQIATMVWTAQFFTGSSRTLYPAQQDSNIFSNDILGGRLGLQSNDWEFQAVVLRCSVKFTSASPALSLSTGELVLFSSGAKYDNSKMLAYAEVNYLAADDGTPFAGTTFINRRDGFYGTFGYHFGRVLPHYTYAYAHSDTGLQNGDEASHSVGVNYSIDPSLVFKAQYTSWKDSDGTVSLSRQGTAQTIMAGFDFVF